MNDHCVCAPGRRCPECRHDGSPPDALPASGLTVAVDFDGTIAESAWPEIGAELPGASEAIKRLYAAGHRLILWTCREGASLCDALTWLEERNLLRCFAQVNAHLSEQIDRYGTDPRKLGADVFVDDRDIHAHAAGGIDWSRIPDMIAKRAAAEQETP